MGRMYEISSELMRGPFTVEHSRQLGLPRGVLVRRFIRLHPRVWCHPEHLLSLDDRVLAATLALPDRAKLTGISRIQQLGLDFGPRTPIRFVIRGDHHLALDGIFLHRTKRLPPYDHHGVAPEAAFIAYCSLARVIDAIKVGDWLLRDGHLTVESVRALALRELWRAGAQEAVWILERLDGRSRSLPESETRAILEFAGLPRPELNVALDDGPEPQVIVDLRYEWWGLVVEYEGSQHQEDRGQYVVDIGRYAWMRRHRVPYVQVTKEKLRHPRTLAGEVYAALVALGYDGPPPEFGNRWLQLFGTISNALGPRERRPALPAGRRAVS
jgi:hypothetical protein